MEVFVRMGTPRGTTWYIVGIIHPLYIKRNVSLALDER